MTRNNTELGLTDISNFWQDLYLILEACQFLKDDLARLNNEWHPQIAWRTQNKLTPICPKYIYRHTHDRQQLEKYSVSTGPPWLVHTIADKQTPKWLKQAIGYLDVNI